MLINWEDLDTVEHISELLHGTEQLDKNVLNTVLAIITTEHEIDLGEVRSLSNKLIDLPGELLDYVDDSGNILFDDE
jgi:hypothetical protein